MTIQKIISVVFAAIALLGLSAAPAMAATSCANSALSGAKVVTLNFAPTGGDDTAAINAFIAAQPVGAVIQAQCGTYIHYGDIIVNSRSFISATASGCPGGRATELHYPVTSCPGVGNGCLSGNFPTSAVVIEGNNVILSGFNITNAWTGPRSGTTSPIDGSWDASPTTIWVEKASNYLIENITADGGPGGGFMNHQSTNGVIHNNTISNTLADSISLGNGSSQITADHNTITNCGDDCISVDGYMTDPPLSNYFTITNNSINGGKERGVFVSNANAGLTGDNYAIIVTGNNISNMTNAPAIGFGADSGFCTSGAHDVLVENNTITNSTFFIEIASDKITSGTVGGGCTPATTDGDSHITVRNNTATAITFDGLSLGTNYSTPGSEQYITNIDIEANVITGAGGANCGQINGTGVTVANNNITGFVNNCQTGGGTPLGTGQAVGALPTTTAGSPCQPPPTTSSGFDSSSPCGVAGTAWAQECYLRTYATEIAALDAQIQEFNDQNPGLEAFSQVIDDNIPQSFTPTFVDEPVPPIAQLIPMQTGDSGWTSPGAVDPLLASQIGAPAQQQGALVACDGTVFPTGNTTTTAGASGPPVTANGLSITTLGVSQPLPVAVGAAAAGAGTNNC